MAEVVLALALALFKVEPGVLERGLNRLDGANLRPEDDRLGWVSTPEFVTSISLIAGAMELAEVNAVETDPARVTCE